MEEVQRSGHPMHSTPIGTAAPPSRARWVITTRLRDDQHKRLLSAANAAGKSLNQYVIDQLLPPPTKATAKFEDWFAELALHAAAFPRTGHVVLSLRDNDAVEWRRQYDAGRTPSEAWGYPYSRARRRRAAEPAAT